MPHLSSPAFRRRLYALALAATISLATHSHAATIGIWTSGSGEWTDPANWTALPNAPDDIAIFQNGLSSPISAITLAAPVTVGQITLDGLSAGYRFDAASPTGSLTFSSTTGTSKFLVTSALNTIAPTLTLPISLASNLQIFNDSTAPLVFTGSISGTGDLILSHTGEVDLRGNNPSYNGNILIDSGRLSTLSGTFNSLGIPTSGTITVSPGASLDISGIVATSNSQLFTKTLQLSGNGNTSVPGALAFGAINTTLLGPIVLGASGATFYGKSDSALLNIGDPATTATTSSLTGGPLIKTGSGVLQINIPATYTGGTFLNAGTLQLGPNGSLVGTGNVTVTAGATLKLSRPAGTDAALHTVSPNALALNGGLVQILADLPLSNLLSPLTTSGVITLDNDATFTSGGTNLIDFSTLNAVVRLGTNTHTTLGGSLTLIPDATHILHFGRGTGTLTINSNIADIASQPTAIEVATGNVTVFAGANTYTGITILNSAGTVLLTHAQGFGSPISGTTINASTTLQVQAATAEPFTIHGGAVNVTSPYAGSVSITGGSFNVNSTFSGLATISNGFLFLGTPSTGAITMSGGTLAVYVPSATAISSTGGLLVASFTGSYMGSVSLADTQVSLNASSVTFALPLTIFGNVTTANFNRVQLQAPGLIGAGTFTASIDNLGRAVSMNFTGPVTFSGTWIQNASAHFTSVASAGIMILNDPFGSNSTVDTQFALNGTLRLRSGLTLNGAAQITQALVTNAGKLTINNVATIDHLKIATTFLQLPFGGLFGNGTIILTDGHLDFQSGVFAFTGPMPGLAEIVKTSSGLGQLAALPSNFSGSVTVAAGELQLGSTLPASTSPINVNPGAFLSAQSGIYFNPINFVGTGSLLLLNAQNVSLAGPLILATGGTTFVPPTGSTQPILNISGSLSGGPLTISGGLDLTLSSATSTLAGMNISGALTPYLNANVTFYEYRNATVRLRTSLTSNAPILLGMLASITIDNTLSLINDRIPDTAPLEMQGGTLILDGMTGSSVATSEVLGNVTATRGINAFQVMGKGVSNGNSVKLTLTSLTRSTGAIIDFEESVNPFFTGYLGQAPNGPQVLLAGQAPVAFLTGAYVYGLTKQVSFGEPVTNFVKYTANGVTPLTAPDYFNGPESDWNNTRIPLIPNNGSLTLSASRDVAALKLGSTMGPSSSGTLNLAGQTLNVQSGGIILSNQSAIIASAGGRLTAGGTSPAAELFLHSQYVGNVILAVPITDNPGPDGLYDPTLGGALDADNGKVSVVYSGNMIFAVTGSNTYTGTTFINGATVSLDSPTAATKGSFVVNQGNLIFNGAYTTSASDVALRAGAISGAGTLVATSYTVESGSLTVGIAGSGSLYKTTSGIAFLGSPNSNLNAYSGTITVQGGTLNVPMGAYSNVIVVQSGTFASPYVSAGTFSLTGKLTLGDGALINIASNAPVFAPSSLTLTGNASLLVQSSLSVGGNSDPFTDSADPTRHINLLLTDASGANLIGNLSVTQGSKNLRSLVAAGATVNSGASLTVDSLQIRDALSVNGNVTLRQGGQGANKTTQLVIAGATNAWIGTMDITDQTLIISPTANRASTLMTLENQALSGWHGGDWLGKGITSANAAADSTHLAVGIFDNANLGLATVGNASSSVDENSIILSLARLGDANFDAAVDSTDLIILSNHWLTAQSSWATGDLNYDGVVNTLDLAPIANSWQASQPYLFALMQFAPIANSLGTVTVTTALNYAGSITLAAGTLQIGNGGTTGTLGTGTIRNSAVLAINRTDTLTVPNDISGTGTLSHTGSGTTTLAGLYSATGSINVAAGKLIFANTTASRQTPAILLTTRSLTLAPSTILDATNHDLMIGNSNLATISDAIKAAFNLGNPAPSSPALTSSTALSNGNTFLVPIDADVLLGNGTPGSAIGYIFDGVAITQPHTILVKYAYKGDVTLDGTINALDFATASGNYSPTIQTTPGLADISTSWRMGDVNFDGFVDDTDFTIMSTNANTSQLSPLGAINLTPVPEPTTLSLLLLSLPTLLNRPKRKPRLAS